MPHVAVAAITGYLVLFQDMPGYQLLVNRDLWLDALDYHVLDPRGARRDDHQAPQNMPGHKTEVWHGATDPWLPLIWYKVQLVPFPVELRHSAPVVPQNPSQSSQ